MTVFSFPLTLSSSHAKPVHAIVQLFEPHLVTKAPGNTVKATVTRQVFLGASRDYMVETADGTTLRVVTQTENAVPAGTEVWLTLPPNRCRALSR